MLEWTPEIPPGEPFEEVLGMTAGGGHLSDRRLSPGAKRTKRLDGLPCPSEVHRFLRRPKDGKRGEPGFPGASFNLQLVTCSLQRRLLR